MGFGALRSVRAYASGPGTEVWKHLRKAHDPTVVLATSELRLIHAKSTGLVNLRI
jgi:hypothetical protein